MEDEQPILINQSMRFVNLMFWFFAIVGFSIIVWNYRDDLKNSFKKVSASAKKIVSSR
jgi:hypothetical protein